MSSGPMPIPRIRPSSRKPTTIPKSTHRHAMAMSESRALVVMGTSSRAMVNDSVGYPAPER